jgi:hypothetical protein
MICTRVLVSAVTRIVETVLVASLGILAAKERNVVTGDGKAVVDGPDM